MTAGDENVAKPRPVGPSTRCGCAAIASGVANACTCSLSKCPRPPSTPPSRGGFLKPEETTQAWSVIEGVYATQLSERALNWLTDNAVITPEQRTNAAAILRCISNWVEQAAAP